MGTRRYTQKHDARNKARTQRRHVGMKVRRLNTSASTQRRAQKKLRVLGVRASYAQLGSADVDQMRLRSVMVRINQPAAHVRQVHA